MRCSGLVVGAMLAFMLASSAEASAGDPQPGRRPRPAAPMPTAVTPSARDVHTVRVETPDGQLVAVLALRPDTGTSIAVPPGKYRLVDADGSSREVEVGDDGILVARAAPVATTATLEPAAATTMATAGLTASPPSTPRRARPAVGRHARWGAPLAAVFIPGLGHAIARRPAAGFGIFAGAAALTFASVATGIGGDRREGTELGDAKRSAAREVLRSGGFVLASDALALLWIGQIADAWVQATGKIVRGRSRHVVSLSLQRASAVGMRPGEPAIARYDDFTVAVLGQVHPRLSVGLADLGLHLGGIGRPVTVQVGARIAGRVVERDRFWLVVAGGAILQGTRARSSLPDRQDGTIRRERGRFGATLYAQLEARIFVLDRLSLDVAPRFSMPLTTRYYGHDRAIPRWAPTFELVAGPTVYF